MSTFAPINNFLYKTSFWAFSPPSDNLWMVDIKLYNSGSGTSGNINSLYTNIITVNSKWSNLDNWSVTTDSSAMTSYLTQFTDGSGVFLAQDINVDSNSINTNSTAHSALQGSSGFITFGDIVNSKNPSLTCKINFLSSNYDIHDVLFDRWIAAIGQQGLIESTDSSFPNIKADIYIYNYASGTPDKSGFTLRKTIKIQKAYPVSREASTNTYAFEDAGTFKSKIITFNFENYSILYNSAITPMGTSVSTNTYAPSYYPYMGDSVVTPSVTSAFTSLYYMQ